MRPRGGAATRRSQELKSFIEKKGPTPQCSGCKRSWLMVGGATKPQGSQKHSTACQVRRTQWAREELEATRKEKRQIEEELAAEMVRAQALRTRSTEMGETPDEKMEQKDAESGDSMSMEQQDAEIERGMKRAREEEEREMLEEQKEDNIEDFMIYSVSGPGPPWFDTNTGLPLEEARVKKGMEKERMSPNSFKTYVEADASEPVKYGVKPIRSGWVLTDRGETVKARLVAQEVNHGDWADVFAATPTWASLRLLLQMALKKGWKVKLADIATAFLHAVLDESERVYITPPATENAKGKVWRLLRSLYGLRKSPQRFQEHFAVMMRSIGFRRLLADPQIFYHEETGALVVAHVDDLMIAASEEDMPKIIKQIDSVFKVKWGEELGDKWSTFLGKQWRIMKEKVYVRIPEKYYETILAEHGLERCRTLSTPCVVQRAEGDDRPVDEERGHLLRRTIGRLMWIVPERPDLAFAVKEMARRVQNPTEQDLGVLKRLLRYIRGTTKMQLCLTLNVQQENQIVAIVDASWASGRDHRSTSGGTLWLDGYLLGQWSRTQPVVAQSTCEAELLALNTGAAEAKLIQSVLAEMNVNATTKVCSDSSSAVLVTTKRGLGRMRHMHVRQLWLQDEVKEGRINIEHLPGEVNVADLLTKPLPTARFEMLMANLGMELESDKEEALVAPIERYDGMIPIDLEMWIAEVENMDIIGELENNEYANDDDLLLEDPAGVVKPKCLHCHYTMMLMITESGVATWRCGWCSAMRPWTAYHDVDKVQEMVKEDSTWEHYFGQDHDPMWMPDFQSDGWSWSPEAASSSTAPSSTTLPVSQPATSCAASRVQDAPTQKQVNYLAVLCKRREKNFHDVMSKIHTKAQASLKIDELIRTTP